MTNKERNKRIEFSPLFLKRFKQSSPAIKIAFREALEVFIENPFYPALRNHALRKQYSGHRSIDVTDNWRAIYRDEPNKYIFVELGTHPKLYGR